MGTWGSEAFRQACHSELLLPLLLSLLMAGTDLARQRIPNYLTFGGAAAGLGLQLGGRGWPGLLDGLAGGALGLLLLLWPYLQGGLGAGDVKGLAALGVCLGLDQTLYLFVSMAFAGGLISIAALIRQRGLRALGRRGSTHLLNWILCQARGEFSLRNGTGTRQVPYGTALALGMIFLWGRQLWLS